MEKLEWQRRQRQERKEKGLCVDCGHEANGFVSCKSCRDKYNQRQQTRNTHGTCGKCNNSICGMSSSLCEKCLEGKRKKSKKRRRNRLQNGRCSSCNCIAKENRCLCEKCATQMREKYWRNRALVFAAYGNKCVQCGESTPEFLQIDHIDGGGRRHRRSLSINFYAWLIKTRFPDGFQVLCANCNQSKYQKRKTTVDKLTCFNAYGGAVCACCGEKDIRFLEMDHINNNGAEMRKLHGQHRKIYRWLRVHDDPQGYQVLCSKCNWGKRFVSICPHKANNNV